MKFKALTCLTLFGGLFAAQNAYATDIEYMIDHGTPGVITSNSKMSRIVLNATGDCSKIPYEVITDGVKSLTGTLNLTKPLSLPLDFTTLTLSCSDQGVSAKVKAPTKSLFE